MGPTWRSGSEAAAAHPRPLVGWLLTGPAVKPMLCARLRTWSCPGCRLRGGSSLSWKQCLSGCIPARASKNIVLIKKKITRKTGTNCDF